MATPVLQGRAPRSLESQACAAPGCWCPGFRRAPISAHTGNSPPAGVVTGPGLPPLISAGFPNARRLAGPASVFQTARTIGMCQTRPLRLRERPLGQGWTRQPATSPPVWPAQPCDASVGPCQPLLGTPSAHVAGDQVCCPGRRPVCAVPSRRLGVGEGGSVWPAAADPCSLGSGELPPGVFPHPSEGLCGTKGRGRRACP